MPHGRSALVEWGAVFNVMFEPNPASDKSQSCVPEAEIWVPKGQLMIVCIVWLV